MPRVNDISIATNKVIGTRIRSSRITAGLSLAQLASKVGITPQQLQKYETGANRIAACRLADLAKALNASVLDFLEPLLDQDKATLSRIDIEISRACAKLSFKRKKVILALIRDIGEDDKDE